MPEIISTHAPLAGRDTIRWNRKLHRTISTHAPLAGRDKNQREFALAVGLFLLTGPSRGATDPNVSLNWDNHFYSRAPRGARRPTAGYAEQPAAISTHAPLAGRDVLPEICGEDGRISTHAPLAGRD